MGASGSSGYGHVWDGRGSPEFDTRSGRGILLETRACPRVFKKMFPGYAFQ